MFEEYVDVEVRHSEELLPLDAMEVGALPSLETRGPRRLRPAAERFARAPLGLLQRLAEVQSSEGSQRRARHPGQFDDEKPIRAPIPMDVHPFFIIFSSFL